jgi:hypothetical protein
MKYVRFFQKSATTPYRLIEACGDRAVVILDGRETNRSHSEIAREECAKRGYLAYQLFKGDGFARSQPYSPVTCLEV